MKKNAVEENEKERSRLKKKGVVRNEMDCLEKKWSRGKRNKGERRGGK